MLCSSSSSKRFLTCLVCLLANAKALGTGADIAVHSFNHACRADAVASWVSVRALDLGVVIPSHSPSAVRRGGERRPAGAGPGPAARAQLAVCRPAHKPAARGDGLLRLPQHPCGAWRALHGSEALPRAHRGASRLLESALPVQCAFCWPAALPRAPRCKFLADTLCCPVCDVRCHPTALLRIPRATL